MTREEILEFVQRSPVFGLATLDEGRPRVRMMMLAMVEDGELVFTTGRDKAVCAQMTANPTIEMCFYSADEGLQVRVEGTVEQANDDDLKKRIVEKFEFLKPWIEAEGLDVLVAYRVKNSRASSRSGKGYSRSIKLMISRRLSN